MSVKIIYVKHHQIDKNKWDRCIENSKNGIVFGLSLYLDNLCPNWDALISDDYSAVMPIIHGKKYFIDYIYNPYFSARTGIFSTRDLTKDMMLSFFDSIPGKYKLISIKFNINNLFYIPGFKQTSNVNYVLHLNRDYNNLVQNFSKNHKKNIKKALSQGIYIKQEENISDLVRIKKEMMQKLPNQKKIKNIHFDRLYNTLYNLTKFIKYVSYNVYDKTNNICGSAVFLIAFNKAIIYSATTPEGKKLRSGYAVVNQFIKDFADSNIILDFAGSNIKGIADFNSGFGSVKQLYPCYSKLKFPLSLFSS